MQVLGTVNIGQNIENAQNCEINNFQNSSQHKSTANVQPQIATPAETNSQATCPEVKPIRLNPDVDKIDFIRVINAMCEYGFFTTPSGVKAYKKDVFAALGALLDENLSSFHKNLSEGASHTADSNISYVIFEELLDCATKYEDSKLQRERKK